MLQNEAKKRLFYAHYNTKGRLARTEDVKYAEEMRWKESYQFSAVSREMELESMHWIISSKLSINPT